VSIALVSRSRQKRERFFVLGVLQMAEQQKTWAETNDWKPRKDDGLATYLIYAVHQTCRHTGWDWSAARQTETFCKIEAWAPGTVGVGCDIYFDLVTAGNLVQFAFVSGMRSHEVADAKAFRDAFYKNLVAILVQWRNEHPE
jgi:hypothetical protein